MLLHVWLYFPTGMIYITNEMQLALFAQVLSCWASLSHSSPCLYLCPSLLYPRDRIWHLHLLNFSSLLIVQYSNVSRSFCKASPFSKESAAPPSLVSSLNFLGMLSTHASRSLVKMLNWTGPSTEPWGAALVTDCQPDVALFAMCDLLSSGAQRSVNLFVLLLDRLFRRMLWGTIWKAFLKSTTFLSSIKWVNLS